MHSNEWNQINCGNHFRQIFQCRQHPNDWTQLNYFSLLQSCPQYDRKFMIGNQFFVFKNINPASKNVFLIHIMFFYYTFQFLIEDLKKVMRSEFCIHR